ncbi:hypothetical protein RI129_003340 [Pyrocoelia pectoralis]|uniref:Ornithine decarboxylase antizyme n=1 Tax=Pyrocoelia pectoralis TaxID=417401 RepID=A0AAN7VR98_9COLE
MNISASEALNNTDNSENNNLEDMLAVLKRNNMEEFMLNSKRSAMSASFADCFKVSLGTGPLWWLTFKTARQPWDAVLLNQTLFVALPPTMLPEGSREAFIALLEAAEEQLKCRHVVVVFEKDRSDRSTLIRTFMFLGFAILSPTSPILPSSLGAQNVCMMYLIE